MRNPGANRKSEVALTLLLLSFMTGCALRIGKMSLSQKQNRLAIEQARTRHLATPVAKTKTYISISQLLLSLASDAVRRGDMEDLTRLMDQYIESVQLARDTIVLSHRNAARHPKGYQELEIALRIQSRLLRELRSRLTLDDRPKVESAELIVTAAHEEMLRLIFPRSEPTALPLKQGFHPIAGQ